MRCLLERCPPYEVSVRGIRMMRCLLERCPHMRCLLGEVVRHMRCLLELSVRVSAI